MTAAVSGGGGVGQIAAEGAAAAMLMRGLPSGAADVNDDAHVATENGGATADGGPGGDGSSSGDGGAPSGATAVDGSGDTPGAGTESTDEAGFAGAGEPLRTGRAAARRRAAAPARFPVLPVVRARRRAVVRRLVRRPARRRYGWAWT